MKSIRRNFVFNALINVSQVLFPLITAPYVARVLNPEGLGLANFSAQLVGYFFMFASLGLPTHAMREVTKVRDDKEKLSRLVSEVFTLSLILHLSVGLIYYSSLFVVERFRENLLLFSICGIGFWFSCFDVGWYFNGTERFGFIAGRHFIVRIVSIICLFLFVKDADDVEIYVLLNILCLTAGQIWGYFEMHRDGVKVRLRLKGLLSHLKPSFILFASTVAISIYTVLDSIMLGFIDGYSEVAFYNCATHISKVILGLVTSLSAVTLPRISYYVEKGAHDEVSKLFNKSISFVSFLAIPAAFGLCCIAPVFAPLFYGDGFNGTILPLQIMSFVIIAIGFSNLTTWQAL
ncbi:MAG: flippase, partial [Bacteroidaceae bacterium]|nr:flippase [Bacteroidaceae bacterium]